ncbi:MAG: transglutaminase family protein, partial [Cyanobacteriota bacterium]|nr:transglutaminase family protein [Cyanobacteriota bacterium]
KQGSCRDTAWLLVQILRHYGFAARFVSGYLIQLKSENQPPDDTSTLQEDNGDLHAWAEVYLPGAGWLGLDPTSGFLAAEGHIPLVCSAHPNTASPIRGTAEPSQSELEFSLTISRYQAAPSVSKPYSEKQWQNINALGDLVEKKLQELNVGLTMGGEPTFISIDDFESPQWRVEALGEDKRKLAEKLLKRLEKRFSIGGSLLHYGVGKLYPGELIPRWALGCYWRENGEKIWHNSEWLAGENQDYSYTQIELKNFIETLSKYLGVNPDFIIPAYESKTDELAGYILPILPIQSEQSLHWMSCEWELSSDKLYLIPGSSSLGFRLPLNKINWSKNLVQEAQVPLNHPPVTASKHNLEVDKNSIRIALTMEVRQGTVCVFLPPLTSNRCFLDLIAAIETTATEVKIPVLIEGYPPPEKEGIISFQITPDPGVIEVNIHPASNWEELVEITTTLYEEARLCRLGTEKYLLDGRRISTGGGSHITIGGETVEKSPLLHRPDLLKSLISYWQNHPSLSYLFSGLFVGPSSQSPRLDEARHESLYELEIAFKALEQGSNIDPEILDSLLRNLLVDMTGNSHRTAFCIDKLFPIDNPRNQLGLLEFRAFAMAPHAQMSLVQMLLIRALVAWFWEVPYTQPLIRWGTTLHDRFMLPFFLEVDLREVLADLQSVGYQLELEWFAPFFEFRFPKYGEITKERVTLELRQAIEPWHVLGQDTTSRGTARYVDDSLERIQVLLKGAMGNSSNIDSFLSRYLVLCNGQQVPLKSTGIAGEYVGGIRFRARQYFEGSHPATEIHHPLLVEIVDAATRHSIGGCTYHVNSPSGKLHSTFPINPREAESRTLERFVAQGHTPGEIKIEPLNLDSEYPLTLDLRRFIE